MAITVARLLTADVLTDAEVIAGKAGLDRPARSVTPGPPPGKLREIEAGAVVVFAADHLTVADLNAEVAIRIAASVGAAALMFTRTAIPVTTRRLSDKLQLPVVLIDGPVEHGLLAELEQHVRVPELSAAQAVRALVHRLPSLGHDPDGLLKHSEKVLRSPIALVDTDGRCVRGSPAAADGLESPHIVEILGARHPAARTVQLAEDALVVLHPVTPASGAANLWLAASVRTDAEDHVDAAQQCLAIAAWPLAVGLLADALDAERQNRQRALLLTEIVEHTDPPQRRTVEQATAIGWRLSGWHTAVALASHDPPDRFMIRLIEDGLRDAGLDATVVERPAGWVFWLTTEAQPLAEESRQLVAATRRSLRVVGRPDLRLCAGVGLPYQGISGIRRSIQDAEHACLLARTRAGPAAVEHIDGTGVRRLLVGYYANQPLREVAAQMVGPLWSADPSGELTRTLSFYLDNKASATATADALGVHRNTVLHRIERINTLLELDLTNPDDRLAAQLASRLAEIEHD